MRVRVVAVTTQANYHSHRLDYIDLLQKIKAEEWEVQISIGGNVRHPSSKTAVGLSSVMDVLESRKTIE